MDRLNRQPKADIGRVAASDSSQAVLTISSVVVGQMVGTDWIPQAIKGFKVSLGGLRLRPVKRQALERLGK